MKPAYVKILNATTSGQGNRMAAYDAASDAKVAEGGNIRELGDKAELAGFQVMGYDQAKLKAKGIVWI